jgi:hypothetical protein
MGTFPEFDRPDDPPPPIPTALAIARGQRLVNRPVKLLLWFGLIIAVAGFSRSYWFALALPLGWLIGWTWWSFAAPRWRLWALSRGVQPRALQWYAEKARLLWPVGHWGERTEFGSSAVRRASQPSEPFRDAELNDPAQFDLAPGFAGPPSDRAFLLWVAFWTVVQPAGMSLLNLFRENPQPVSEYWFLGLQLGIIFAAFSYAKERWRVVVSPEHALGLGLLGVILGAMTWAKGVVSVPWYVDALGALLLVPPSSLVLLAALEWRRRQRAP